MKEVIVLGSSTSVFFVSKIGQFLSMPIKVFGVNEKLLEYGKFCDRIK